jgi:hypothetical protein
LKNIKKTKGKHTCTLENQTALPNWACQIQELFYIHKGFRDVMVINQAPAQMKKRPPVVTRNCWPKEWLSPRSPASWGMYNSVAHDKHESIEKQWQGCERNDGLDY